MEENRKRIEEIDAEIARLFCARMELCKKIGEEKQKTGAPVRDPVREADLLNKTAAAVPADLRGDWIALQRELFARSRAVQTRQALAPAFWVPLGDGCPIHLGRGLLSRAGELLDLDRRVLLVTDDGVPAAYAETLAAQCKAPHTVTVAQGEASKAVAVWERLLLSMQTAGFTRFDCVAAIGGGTVCDLAGFAAAAFLRGIDFYAVPTTVLSQVDASVGGKSALDLGGIKNAVGAIRQPTAVLIDPDVLQTLPPREVRGGLAEALKMGLTSDPDLVALFETEDPAARYEEILARALAVKIGVVARDEREAGERRVLNFGHTLGHAIEAASHGTLTHGECVALGMLPLCAPEVRERVLPIYARLGLPVRCRVDPEAAFAALCRDKKTCRDGLRLITVPAVGRWAEKTVQPQELRPLLARLIGEEIK